MLVYENRRRRLSQRFTYIARHAPPTVEILKLPAVSFFPMHLELKRKLIIQTRQIERGRIGTTTNHDGSGAIMSAPELQKQIELT
jgi:hypothetical protein